METPHRRKATSTAQRTVASVGSANGLSGSSSHSHSSARVGCASQIVSTRVEPESVTAVHACIGGAPCAYGPPRRSRRTFALSVVPLSMYPSSGKLTESSFAPSGASHTYGSAESGRSCRGTVLGAHCCTRTVRELRFRIVYGGS